ncbi:DUF6984 family protein [Flaviaesturariibacter terrae]
MARPIKPEERLLIEHLVSLAPGGRSYAIPGEVENLGEGGLGGIQLSGRGTPEDLVEASYRDEDGKSVLLTLTVNEHGELYDLDIWKMDFSPLLRYPTPDRVRLDD